jgi:hypothetical protein
MGARRPDSQFKPEYCDLARRVAMLGATNDNLAAVIGVCRRTIDNWLQDYPGWSCPSLRDCRSSAFGR